MQNAKDHDLNLTQSPAANAHNAPNNASTGSPHVNNDAVEIIREPMGRCPTLHPTKPRANINCGRCHVTPGDEREHHHDTPTEHQGSRQVMICRTGEPMPDMDRAGCPRSRWVSTATSPRVACLLAAPKRPACEGKEWRPREDSNLRPPV